MNTYPSPGVLRLLRRRGVPTRAFNRRVEAALQAGDTVEFFRRTSDRRPAFELRPKRGFVRVIDDWGRCVGTFANAAAAMTHGWSRSETR